MIGPRHAPVRIGGLGDFAIRVLRARSIDPTCLLMYLSMPEVASWKRPPTELQELVERLDFRRIPRHPITFDLAALEALNRRYARHNGIR